MKKKGFFGVLALVVGFVLMFGLAGCGDNGDPSSPPGGGGNGLKINNIPAGAVVTYVSVYNYQGSPTPGDTADTTLKTAEMTASPCLAMGNVTGLAAGSSSVPLISMNNGQAFSGSGTYGIHIMYDPVTVPGHVDSEIYFRISFSSGNATVNYSLERAQQTQEQGQNAGWPPASAFQNYYRLSSFAQPAGTTARYDENDYGRRLVIYLTGGNSNTVLQNLKQQVEKVTGRQMSQNGNEYSGFSQDPNNRNGNIRFLLRLESNVVTLEISPVAG